MSERLDDLYRDIILDHYRSPRGKEPVGRVDIASSGQNPSCGDELMLEVEMEDGTVKNIHIDCRGCAISVASGSMLAEVLKGKSIEEAKQIAGIVKGMLKGEDVEVPDEFEDLDALHGVKKFPVRIKCALLAWITFIEGLKDFENGKTTVRTTVSTEENE